MFGYTAAPRAWGITRDMARRIGLDLPAAVVEGWLSPAELAGLVERCAICPRQQCCEAWLAAPEQAAARPRIGAPAAGIPSYCPNRIALEALVVT